MKTTTSKLPFAAILLGLSMTAAQGESLEERATRLKNQTLIELHKQGAMSDAPDKKVDPNELQGVPFTVRKQNDLDASLNTKNNLNTLLGLSEQYRNKTWTNFKANPDDPDAKAAARDAMNDYKKLVDWRNRISKRATDDSLALQDAGVNCPFVPPDDFKGAPLPNDVRDLALDNVRDAAKDAAKTAGRDGGRDAGKEAGKEAGHDTGHDAGKSAGMDNCPPGSMGH